MDVVRGLLGIAALLGIAWTLSSNRKAVSLRLVASGLGIQFLLAVFILRGEALASVWSPLGWPKAFFTWLSSFFVIVLDFTTEGARFIFGDLALSPGQDGSLGGFFAFQVLPTIIFFAALTAVLYHYKVLQSLVGVMARIMQRLLGTSGAESLSVISNIFVGQTEAPLVVRPYLERMTRSELMAVMTGGMATIAGGVMAAYVQMLGNAYSVANGLDLTAGRLLFAEQLLGASLMAAPAALVIAKILVPETETSETMGKVKAQIPLNDANGIDAAASGAATGLKLAGNVGGMLLAFIGLLAMVNFFLDWAGGMTGLSQWFPGGELRIETILGYLLSPVAFLVGIPAGDLVDFGSLLGTKVVLNEFVAYLELSDMISQGILDPKTIVMATFALCGFANFSSIAIQIGGIGGLALSRKPDIARLGLLAVLAGSMANLMTATIAGILLA